MKKYVVKGRFLKAFNSDTYDSIELVVDENSPLGIETVNLNELLHSNIEDGDVIRVIIEVTKG